jgi:TrmH family RNA methyltransferase
MDENDSASFCSKAFLSNIAFVVVKPVYLGNIGAVARAMKNFALSDLRLVDPPKNYKDAEARKMSVGAFDILKGAKLFDSLDDALHDISISVGTTSGKQRKLVPLPLCEVSSLIRTPAEKNKVAFIFGDERDGLRQEDLNRCHHIVTIPTSPLLPSLNLAQAACVIGYELCRSETQRAGSSGSGSEEKRHSELSTGAIDSELLQLFSQISDSVNFSRTFNKGLVLSEFRQLWQRTTPTKREADLLKGVLIRLQQHLALRQNGSDEGTG